MTKCEKCKKETTPLRTFNYDHTIAYKTWYDISEDTIKESKDLHQKHVCDNCIKTMKIKIAHEDSINRNIVRTDVNNSLKGASKNSKW